MSTQVHCSSGTILDAGHHCFFPSTIIGGSQTIAEPLCIPVTFRNWKVVLDAPPGVGKTRTLTIHKNDVATALTLTFGAADTEQEILGVDVHFDALDTIRLTSGSTGIPGSGFATSTIEIEPDTDGLFIYGYNCSQDTPEYVAPFGANGNAWTVVTNFARADLIGIDGDIVAWACRERTAPGVGNARIYTPYLSDVAQDGSGGTVNAQQTIADTNTVASSAFVLPITAGQHLGLRRTASGTPVGSTVTNGTFAFRPTDVQTYMLNVAMNGMVTTGTPEYAKPQDAPQQTWTAPETAKDFIGHPTRTTYVSSMRCVISAATGDVAKSWTFTFRKNAADTALVVVINGALTTASASVSPPIQIQDGDTWSIQTVAAGSPSSTTSSSRVSLGVTNAPPAEVTFENATTEIGIHWVEHTTADDETHVWSKYYLPDPANYYHGEKLELVTKWNQIRRSLSDRRGQYSGTIYGYVLSDTDHSLRTIAADEVTQYLINNPTVIRSIPDADRRALLTPRTVVRGVVREIQPLSPLLFGVTCEDWLSKRFRVGNNERQIPDRLIKDDIPTAPEASLEKGVPIVYGLLSDQDTEVTEVGTTLPYNAALPAINTAGCRDLATPGATLTGGITCIVCGVKTGAEGPISNPAGTTHYAPHALQFGWDQDTTFDSYNAYFFDAPWLDWTPQGGVRPGATVTFVRKLTHDNSTFDGWSSKDMAVVLEHITDGTDALSGVATVSVDQGKGVIAPIYVGTQTISSTRYHKFVIAGHACKAIDELYVEGLAQNLATDATQAGVGGIWLIPGYAGWTAAFGATVYEVINGRRYTVIYGKTGNRGPDLGAGEMVPDTIGVPVADHIPPLSVNVQGIETVGDGTGTLITKVIDQMYHFAVNYVAQDYAGGDWAAVPTFADDATLPLVNQDSFDAADAIGDTQLVGGIVGAGMFTDPITLREAFARFAVSAGVRYGFNRKTQLAAFKLSDDPDLTTAPHYTQELDILKDSFHLRTMQDDWANEIPYAFGRNYATGEWATETSIADSESIANYGETKVLELQTYWFLRDAAIASDVASRELLWRRIPPNVVTLETPLRGLNDDQGDYIRVTHASGLGPTGWTEQPTWIVRHEVDPDRNKVWLELEDIARYVGSPSIGGGPFVLGDEGVIAETWLTATDADKAYGYLSDATTGAFTDGALGKELR